MLVDQKKRRVRNPVTALSNGFEEGLRRRGYAASTIWQQRRLLNDLIGSCPTAWCRSADPRRGQGLIRRPLRAA